MLTPTFFINGQVLRLDRSHYIALAAGETVGNRIELEPGCSNEQCDGCGRDITETGNLIGNPTHMTEKGYDTCSVECRECDNAYPVVWKEIK